LVSGLALEDRMADEMTNQPTLVPEQDANDGREWSAADVEDLRLALKDGGSVEGAAYFLCRGGTIEEVRQKAKELGLLER
jgi:hypothetical protein